MEEVVCRPSDLVNGLLVEDYLDALQSRRHFETHALTQLQAIDSHAN